MDGEESAPTPQTDTAWAQVVVKLVAATPFALATLAVLYDAGYFARIGFDFFSLFSLTEHLMFGMEGIPYLIIILVLVYFVVVLALRDPTHQAKTARNLYWAGLASLVFGVPGSLFLYPSAWPNAALIFVTALMFMLWATERSSYAVVTIAGNFVIWLLTSFTLGYWMAAGILNPRDVLYGSGGQRFPRQQFCSTTALRSLEGCCVQVNVVCLCSTSLMARSNSGAGMRARH